MTGLSLIHLSEILIYFTTLALNQKLEKFVKLAESTVARLEPHVPRTSPTVKSDVNASVLIGTKICNVCFQGRLNFQFI